ncbi:hypothetical protein TWF173_001729, partial [Orbilia oligospora]
MKDFKFPDSPQEDGGISFLFPFFNSSSFNPHKHDIPILNCPELSLTEIFAQVAATSSAGSSCEQTDSSGLPFYHPDLTTPCLGIHDQQVIVETNHPQPIDCNFPLDEFEWLNWTDICFEQMHANIISPPEPPKNENLPSSIFDMPELSPSTSSSEMENSPRLSVGTEEMANSSPAASLSPVKDGGQQTPKGLGGDLKRGDILQGGIGFRKVSAVQPPHTKKKPKRATNIRRHHKPKHQCPGCLQKFTVKRDFESHFRRCLGRPFYTCLCGAGITTRHNMKAHSLSTEHLERLRVLEEIPSNSNPGHQKTDGGSSEDPEYRAIQDHTENDDIEGLVNSSSSLQNHELSPNFVTEASAGPSFPAQFFFTDKVSTPCSSLFSSEVISGHEGASTEILRRPNSNYDHVDEYWYAFERSSPIPNPQDPPGPALSDSESSSSSSDGSTPKSDSGLNTESTTPASSPAASRTGLSPRDETLDTPANSPMASGAGLLPRDETLATPDDSPYIPSDLTQYALEQYEAAKNPNTNTPTYTFRDTARRNPSPE